MANYSDIKYNMTLSSNVTGGGNMVLLSTVTASSSSAISFTSGIDSTYKEYIIKIINLHPQTDNQDFSFNLHIGSPLDINSSSEIRGAYFYSFYALKRQVFRKTGHTTI